jgi:hypothetical protein
MRCARRGADLDPLAPEGEEIQAFNTSTRVTPSPRDKTVGKADPDDYPTACFCRAAFVDGARRIRTADLLGAIQRSVRRGSAENHPFSRAF